MPSVRHRRKPMAEINVVPYIDVMLVLLVIFMVTAPLLTPGVKVDLPQAAASAVDNPDRETLVVTVDRKGKLFLDEREIGAEAPAVEGGGDSARASADAGADPR